MENFWKKKEGKWVWGEKKKFCFFLFLFLTHESVIRKKKIKTLCKNENCLACFYLCKLQRLLGMFEYWRSIVQQLLILTLVKTIEVATILGAGGKSVLTLLSVS